MRYVVAGAGGHGKVALDVAICSGIARDHIAGFVDDDPALAGTSVAGFPVIGAIDSLTPSSDLRVLMGIGENGARRRVFDRLRARGFAVATAIHPTAVVARGCRLGDGVVVMANVTVNVDTRVGDNAILNTACTIDHDCVIGAHAHIAPGVKLAGGVTVGSETLVGIGAVAIPGISIGAACIVGAGAVVTANLSDGCVAAGVPARVLRHVEGAGT